uniref:Uncharacterized protein n=1 Tax=Plectus sambesii TaxID=2011161 RepID=A0A914VQV9_9BILA
MFRFLESPLRSSSLAPSLVARPERRLSLSSKDERTADRRLLPTLAMSTPPRNAKKSDCLTRTGGRRNPHAVGVAHADAADNNELEDAESKRASKRTDFCHNEDDLDSTSEKSQEDVLDRMDDFMDNDEPSLSEDEQEDMTSSEHFQMTGKVKYVHRREKRSRVVYRKEWETKYDYLAESQKGKAYFHCIVCVEDLHLLTTGETAVKSHSKSNKHQQAMSQKNKTIPLAQFTSEL